VEIDTTVLWFAFGATVFTRIAFWNRAGMANRETRSRHGSQAGRPWLVHSNVRTASNGLAGPPVTDHDDAEAAPVVLVNQSIVRKFWPNQNPLGKRVQIGNLPKLVQVVGVLGDAKNESLAQAAKDEVFVPHPQLASPQLYLSVRTTLDPHSLASGARAAIALADSDQPVTGIRRRIRPAR
jgi:hypothetical protein